MCWRAAAPVISAKAVVLVTSLLRLTAASSPMLCNPHSAFSTAALWPSVACRDGTHNGSPAESERDDPRFNESPALCTTKAPRATPHSRRTASIAATLLPCSLAPHLCARSPARIARGEVHVEQPQLASRRSRRRRARSGGGSGPARRAPRSAAALPYGARRATRGEAQRGDSQDAPRCAAAVKQCLI
jgi:hypothetical protein